MDTKKLQELGDIQDEHIQRNSGPLGHGELLANQIQSISSLSLADLALYGIALSLVIKKQLFLLGQQLWIALGATEAPTTQENAMTLTEGSIGSRSINLVSTDYPWIVTISASISSSLSLQVFSFVVGIITQMIKKGESSASD
jgi:hypothetical protein